MDVACAPMGASCTVVSGDGQLFGSADPTGGAGAWTATSELGADVTAVSCPSARLCVAVGNSSFGLGPDRGEVYTSSDPASSRWTGAFLRDRLKPLDLTCPSNTLCIATGQTTTYRLNESDRRTCSLEEPSHRRRRPLCPHVLVENAMLRYRLRRKGLHVQQPGRRRGRMDRQPQHPRVQDRLMPNPDAVRRAGRPNPYTNLQ